MQRPLFLHCRLHMAREPLAAQALARDTPASAAATLLNRQKHVPHMLTHMHVEQANAPLAVAAHWQERRSAKATHRKYAMGSPQCPDACGTACQAAAASHLRVQATLSWQT